MTMDPETRARLEQLVDEGLSGLRQHPAPLLAERFACMLGVPPSLAGVPAAETAAIVEVLEQDASPEAVEVLAALDRLIVSPWARTAAAAAERLVAAGVTAASPPVHLRVCEAFFSDVETFALLAVRIEAGDVHFQGTLIAQRTEGGSAHLDGGLAGALAEAPATQRFSELRASFADATELAEAADARKEAARLFAWARDEPAPTTEGLELERPLLALALTGRRDPWPRLSTVPETVSRRMREAVAGSDGARAGADAPGVTVTAPGAPPPRGLSASLERASGAQRAQAKAARAARKRNR